MPIYAYRCETCGFKQDVLQKISDPLLVVCPSCGASTFRKQVTAAGFQLKGSGWYVTDFRNPAAKEAPKGSDAAAEGGKSDAGGADSGKADQSAAGGDKPAPAPAPAPAASSSDAKPAPAPGGGSSS